MFIGFSLIYCFSSYVNSRVTGINVAVIMQMEGGGRRKRGRGREGGREGGRGGVRGGGEGEREGGMAREGVEGRRREREGGRGTRREGGSEGEIHVLLTLR